MPDLLGIVAILAAMALYLGVLGASGTVFVARMFGVVQTQGIVMRFAALGIFAALLSFGIKGAELTGDLNGIIDLEMLSLLWGTAVGTALTLRIFGLSLLILGQFFENLGAWIALAGGVLTLSSFLQTGHIAGLESPRLQAALLFHLLAIALWIGILIPLKRLASNTKTHKDAATLGHRFGKVAMITVPLLIVLGALMGYHLLGSWGDLFATAYGLVLSIKVGLVAALLGLAALNKFRYVPGLRDADPCAAQGLARSISFEWVVILSVLAMSAILTTNVTLPV